MKPSSKALVACAALASAQAALATPSTTFWTPATGYVQPYLVPHLTYDTYVAERGGFQNDYGLTVGVLPWEKLQGEIGFDTFYPGYTDKNFYLNGKLTVPENAYGAWQPAVSLGVMNLGFKKDVTDYDILHANLAKTFPYVGNVAIGGYYGLNDKLMVGSDGKTQQAGFLAAWTSPDIVLNFPGLQKIALMADLQTGKNAFGAVGGGIGLYFTPAIDVLTGPVYFLDPKAMASGPLHPNWLWTVQLDVDVDFMKKKT
jgi:hypothetical protein